MEIKYPTVRRGIPPEHQIREVINLVCTKSEFRPANVRLEIIGGDRKDEFAFKGIKLIRPVQFGVQVFIGCENDAVESVFRLVNGEGRGINGDQLFAIMSRQFNGRIYKAEKSDVSDEDTHPTNTNTPGETEIHEDGDPESGTNTDATETDTESLPADEGGTSPDGGSSGNITVVAEVEYTRYFDNPVKLHLAVFNLVLICNEDTTRLFGFDTFEKALSEADTPKTAGLPVSLIKPFVRLGYIHRVNPDQKPPRYQITEEAVKFANGPVPPHLVGAGKRPEKKPVVEKVKSPPVKENIQETLLRLKKTHEDHQKLLQRIETARKELEALRSVDIEAEENKVAGEAANLRKRLNELETYRGELAQRRSQISVAEDEVQNLETEANDPKTLKAIEQLAEIRSLLA